MKLQQVEPHLLEAFGDELARGVDEHANHLCECESSRCGFRTRALARPHRGLGA